MQKRLSRKKVTWKQKIVVKDEVNIRFDRLFFGNKFTRDSIALGKQYKINSVLREGCS